jgi:hypothetical protein
VLNLPVAGLIFTIFIWLRGPYVDPAVDPEGFARAATSQWFTFSWLAIMAGLVLLIFGYFSLYFYVFLAERPLSRPAFVAMALAGAGIAASIPLGGFMAFAAPAIGELYLQGQESVMQVAVNATGGLPTLLVMVPAGLCGTAGAVLFGVVVWRSGTLPRWTAVPFGLQAPLLAFTATLSFPAEVLGAVLLLVSGAGIAWSVVRRSLGTGTAGVPAVGT